MSDNLDMILGTFSEGRGEKWVTEELPRILDVEYSDRDLMAINILGEDADIQLQIRISKFLELMKARGVPISQILGDTEA